MSLELNLLIAHCLAIAVILGVAIPTGIWAYRAERRIAERGYY